MRRMMYECESVCLSTSPSFCMCVARCPRMCCFGNVEKKDASAGPVEHDDMKDSHSFWLACLLGANETDLIDRFWVSGLHRLLALCCEVWGFAALRASSSCLLGDSMSKGGGCDATKGMRLDSRNNDDGMMQQLGPPRRVCDSVSNRPLAPTLSCPLGSRCQAWTQGTGGLDDDTAGPRSPRLARTNHVAAIKLLCTARQRAKSSLWPSRGMCSPLAMHRMRILGS